VGRIKDILLGAFGTGIGFVYLALLVLSLPFNMLVVMRWWGLEWWTALISVLLLACIPAVGQLAYLVFTFIGAFFFYQSDFDWRKASKPSLKTFSASELTPTQFAEYAQTVLRPRLRDYCIDNSKETFGFQGKVPESIPPYCDCFARIMFEQVTQKEWIENEGMQTAPPAFQERFAKAVKTQCSQPRK
jgi:hypothetical protein